MPFKTRKRCSPLKRCPVCRIRQDLCFCNEIVPIPTRTHVWIVQHFAEQYLSSATAALARRVLPNSSLVWRGLVEPEDWSGHLLPSHTPLYLFPETDAEELTAELVARLPQPLLLVVPDGSWNQARKIKRREPLFREMRSVRLTAPGPSRYLLRNARREGALCTFEAIAHALERIEGPGILEPMERMLAMMVARSLQARNQLDRLRAPGS